MDKALAYYPGGRSSNPDKTKKDFFCLEKFKYVLLSPWVPHYELSLSDAKWLWFLRELKSNMEKT